MLERFAMALAVLLLLLGSPAVAQDTLIYVDLGDANPRIGDTIMIPLLFRAPLDSVAGFSLPLLLSRPSLVEFHDDRVADAVGTLTAGWDIIGGNAFFGTAAQMVGLADGNPPDATPPPLPPILTDQNLVNLVAFVPCYRDPFGDYHVEIVLNGAPEFSDPHGQLISPVSVRPSLIDVQPPLLGDIDQNGSYDVVDLVHTVSCAFRGTCYRCGSLLADVNCSGGIDVVDVVLQIEHILRGGTPPSCI